MLPCSCRLPKGLSPEVAHLWSYIDESSSYAKGYRSSNPIASGPEVISLKASSLIKVAEVPIASPLIQQVTSLWIMLPTKINASPLISHPKPISGLSLFWNPEVEEMNKVTSEFSFFWDPKAEDSEEVTFNSATEDERLSAPVPNPFTVSQVTLAPVQNVSLVRPNTPISIIETQIPSAPVQSISTLHTITPSPIVMTLITSPLPTDPICCSFTSKKVLASLQITSSLQSPIRSTFKRITDSPFTRPKSHLIERRCSSRAAAISKAVM